MEDKGFEVRARFLNLKSPNDLAALLSIRFDRIVWHLYKTSPESRYFTFEIPKKSGGNRLIEAPASALKLIQRSLHDVLAKVVIPKPSVHGFTKGRSILTNATAHCNKRYVFNIDLKDFFPSLHFGGVRGVFMAKPYELPGNVATVLAQIACHNNRLPQGAPTSPIIANMICAKMDAQLQRLARSNRSFYTRYADDLTFSTTLREFPLDLANILNRSELRGFMPVPPQVEVAKPLSSIIKQNDFEINKSKVRLQTRHFRQEVTGLTVNEFPNVPRSRVRNIRAMLHAWDRYGFVRAEQRFRDQHNRQERGPGRGDGNFRQFVHGQLAYLSMIRGKDDPVHEKYVRQYRALVARDLSNKKDMEEGRVVDEF